MLSDQFVAHYANQERQGFNPLYSSFNGLGYVVYKRTYARPKPDGTSEEWHETVRRVVDGANAIGAGLTDLESELLFDHIWNLRGSVAGRGLWQFGTENVNRFGADSLNNCWHVTLDHPQAFSFLFNELMLGGGVGFTITGTERLPAIRPATVTHEATNDADFIIPDKREGWAELLERVLTAYFSGTSFTYSTILIRPEGAPIRTFGGTASGPGILVTGVEQICQVLDNAVGRKLTPVEVMDIANIIGSIVVSGNVRRSAQIALGSVHDSDYLQAKRWDTGTIPAWRAMSNNSVVVEDYSDLTPDFWRGYLGDGEPYGLVHLDNLRTYGRMGELNPDPSISGVNPCAEIGLADYESCNLAEIFLPNIVSYDQLIQMATLLYKVQKAITSLPFTYPESEDIVRQNRRLGLSVTGIAQAGEKLDWLAPAYEHLRNFDAEWSGFLGIPESIRLTTIKPSGTLSLLAGVTPGVHPGFSQFHIRRVRMSASDPLVNWCRTHGYKVEHQRSYDGSEDPRTVVVEFPASFPEGTALASDYTAIDQLDLVRRMQAEWADNSVSATVYYHRSELPEIRDYLAEHLGEFKTLSFLLHSDHGFDQAPLEAITEDQYHSLVDRVIIADSATGISSLTLSDDACATGACPVR